MIVAEVTHDMTLAMRLPIYWRALILLREAAGKEIAFIQSKFMIQFHKWNRLFLWPFIMRGN
jgi:hypothetical protein